MNNIRLLVIVLLISSTTALIHADDTKSISEEAIEKFGELPVRFNGRLTTFKQYAESTLTKLSGRNKIVLESGETINASRWLLEIMSGKPARNNYPVIPSPDPELGKLLGFPEKKQDADGFALLKPSEIPREEIQKERDRLFSIPFDRWTEEVQARFDVTHYSSNAYFDLESAIGTQNYMDLSVDEVGRSIQRSEGPPILRPVARGKFEWESLPRLYARIRFRPDQVPQLSFRLLEIFMAYGKDEAKTFDEKIASYQELLEKAEIDQSPIQFKLPEGWNEIGVPLNDGEKLFSDARQIGRRVISVELRDPKSKDVAGMNVLFFKSAVSPRDYFLNQWRLGHHLNTLSASDLLKTTKPVEVDGFSGIMTSIGSPENSPSKRSRTFAAFLQRGGLTAVVTLFGPFDMVGKLQDDFDTFVRSLKFGDDDALKSWYIIEKDFNDYDGPKLSHGMFVIIPAKDGAFVLELNEYGAERLAKFRKSILQFTESIKVDEEAAVKDALQFKLPEGWQKMDRQSDLIAEFLIGDPDKGKNPGFVTLKWLHGKWTDGTKLSQLNYWRQALYKKPLPEDTVPADFFKPLKIGNIEAMLVEISD